ncbi:tetratricopeptide repeat protein [Pseudoduganella lutea]|uniref:Tetratricopeptide repeat protein n=1 Tax=Pseudoduganella lutea TaxID=321985 RepID=A0A4P6L5A1_9BURK|nr:tetratricopeptide repeat protein [Pseudoduganella lutea]QBE66634.1 tetratricopeptide repeat protein [Pseudoduganella lutea]
MSGPRGNRGASFARKAGPASLDNALVDALRRAIDVHRQGNPVQAAQRYEAILKAAPEHPDALHYLGVARHQLGQHEQALALIGHALDVAPGYVDARNNLGNVQKELGCTPRRNGRTAPCWRPARALPPATTTWASC